MIVMHGTNRDADRYRDEWAEVAEAGRFVVIAPQFTMEAFPGSRGYNLGNLAGRDGAPVSEPEWSFSAIEPLFDHIVRSLASTRRTYHLYGHSAGAQFVHRFLYWKPRARVEIAFSANAGWYTLPAFDQTYPYGLAGSDRRDRHVRAALGRNLVVLLGAHDTNQDRNLRMTVQAMRQGPHRLARGDHFLASARTAARRLRVRWRWHQSTVADAGHQNGRMAWGVLPYLRQRSW